MFSTIEDEYNTYKKLSDKHDFITKLAKGKLNDSDTSKTLKLITEGYEIRKEKMDSLSKLLDLTKNVYVNRLCCGDNFLMFEIYNCYYTKKEDTDSTQPFQISYTIKYNINQNNSGSFNCNINLIPKNHSFMILSATTEEKTDIFNQPISRISNTEVESFGDFTKRCGEHFSKNIIDILQSNNRRTTLVHLTQNNNLEKFQKNFNKLLKKMADDLSVKDYNLTFNAINNEPDSIKKDIIEALDNLNKYYQANLLKRELTKNDKQNTNKKIKI